jgi:hypothetical protein
MRRRSQFVEKAKSGYRDRYALCKFTGMGECIFFEFPAAHHTLRTVLSSDVGGRTLCSLGQHELCHPRHALVDLVIGQGAERQAQEALTVFWVHKESAPIGQD